MPSTNGSNSLGWPHVEENKYIFISHLPNSTARGPTISIQFPMFQSGRGETGEYTWTDRHRKGLSEQDPGNISIKTNN